VVLPLSSHFIPTFSFFFKENSLYSFFFDLNGVERISDAAKTGKAKQPNFES